MTAMLHGDKCPRCGSWSSGGRLELRQFNPGTKRAGVLFLACNHGSTAASGDHL